MIQQCPKLERLLLTLSGIESDTFFLHLALCLPNAMNLRDLRYSDQSLASYIATIF